MFNWDKINQKGVCVRCSSEEETILFLQECEKNNINWKSGLKLLEVSKCYRNISTNCGSYLTEGSDITFDNIYIDFAEVLINV